MESSPLPNLANLNQFFNQYDTDQDGKVNDQEIQKIFQDLGFTDVYIGTIRKVIRLMNVQNPDDKQLNFIQVQEFAEAMITKGKFKIWKVKLGLIQEMKLGLKEIYGDQQSGASPGAGPGNAPAPINAKQFNSQEGEILVNVGNSGTSNQKTDRAAKYFLSYNEVKPFIKISVQTNTKEEATKIDTLFKEMYNVVIEILKAQQEELISEILSVSFITSVNNNVFNLFITTPNQSLIELAEIFVCSLDEVIKNPINGKVQSSFKFNFDFEKFISEPSYNFYDLLVKNSSFHLKWNLWEFFRALRKFALAAKVFEDLEWDQTDEFCLFVIGILHCQKFVGKIEFNSTSSEGQETKSKEELRQIFKGIRESLLSFGQETGLKLVQMVSLLDGRISIEVGVKDWRLNLEVKLKSFVKLLTQKIEGDSDDQGESYKLPIESNDDLVLNKKSSKKSLNVMSDSGSETSKKKKKISAKVESPKAIGNNQGTNLSEQSDSD